MPDEKNPFREFHSFKAKYATEDMGELKFLPPEEQKEIEEWWSQVKATIALRNALLNER